jgi:hypothetical protein
MVRRASGPACYRSKDVEEWNVQHKGAIRRGDRADRIGGTNAWSRGNTERVQSPESQSDRDESGKIRWSQAHEGIEKISVTPFKLPQHANQGARTSRKYPAQSVLVIRIMKGSRWYPRFRTTHSRGRVGGGGICGSRSEWAARRR